MPRNIVYIAMSIDGFIGRENGAVDWLIEEPDYDYYPKFLSGVGVIIMGGETYRMIESFDVDWPYPDQISYVFTTREYDDQEKIKFVRGDVGEFFHNLGPVDKNIWLLGGGDIINQLFKKGLVDELVIAVQPVILGAGIPLFQKDEERKLELLEISSYQLGTVQLHYKVLG